MGVGGWDVLGVRGHGHGERGAAGQLPPLLQEETTVLSSENSSPLFFSLNRIPHPLPSLPAASLEGTKVPHHQGGAPENHPLLAPLPNATSLVTQGSFS